MIDTIATFFSSVVGLLQEGIPPASSTLSPACSNNSSVHCINPRRLSWETTGVNVFVTFSDGA